MIGYGFKTALKWIDNGLQKEYTDHINHLFGGICLPDQRWGMEGMTVEALKQLKQELGFTNEEISAGSGVPLGTVQKFFGGATAQPRRRTIEAIEKMLTQHLGESRTDGMMVHEPGAPYEAPCSKRRYTVEDYYNLPDERRAELIDGVLYDMTTPTFVHQDILRNLVFQLEMCMQAHPCGCRLFFSPMNVQLDCDERTMLQPDILIFCDDTKMRKRVYFGAPDFVVEILSPSTRKKDVTVKLRKYIGASVREYWIVDPDTERVFVYLIEEGELPFICGYGENVPVGISGGTCSIDFTEIWDSARELRSLE